MEQAVDFSRREEIPSGPGAVRIGRGDETRNRSRSAEKIFTANIRGVQWGNNRGNRINSEETGESLIKEASFTSII